MDATEAYSKYGGVPLLFQSYYKFLFSFRGVAEDGAEICTTSGGCHEDIYRFEVNRDEPKTLDMTPLTNWRDVQIKLNGEAIFEHSGW